MVLPDEMEEVPATTGKEEIRSVLPNMVMYWTAHLRQVEAAGGARQ